MSSSNRATILAKVHKVLKKHYKPVEPATNRTVLEHLLYAAVLENADFETADECFAKLQENYFDWNEVRVTTITELSETISTVRDSSYSAQRVKKSLQAVFETHYAFDLEPLKKQNLGKSIADLEKHSGISAFGIAYVSQNALGGHAIPLGRGALEVLLAVGAATEQDISNHTVSGIERAIEKKKGPEFFSLLHQLGADLTASPQSSRVKAILHEIDSHAKERLADWNAKQHQRAADAKQARKDAREAKAIADKAIPMPPPGKGPPPKGAAKGAKGAPAPTPAPAPAVEAKKPAGKPEAAEKGKPAKPVAAPAPVAKPAAQAAKPPHPPAKPAHPPAKPAAKPAAEDKSKAKKPVSSSGSKGLTKRKPK